MKLRILLILTLLCPAFMVSGQNAVTWDLQKCIDYALENNIQVQQSDLNRVQNVIALRGAKMARLPSLNASTNFNITTGRSINPFTNELEVDDIQSQRYNLNSSVTLFNYGSVNNNIKKAVVDLEISEFDKENQKNTTILNVITFYTNVLLNNEQAKNAEFNLNTSQLNLEIVQKQYNLGSVNYQQLLQAKQQLAGDELSLITAQNAYEFAKLNLQQAMQLPVQNEFEVVIPEIPDPDVNQGTDSPVGIYQTALTNQPDILSAEAGVRSAMLGVKISEASLYPTLSFQAGVQTSYSSVAPAQIASDGAPNVEVQVPIGFIQSTGEQVFTTRQVPAEFDDLTYIRQLDFNQNTFVGLNLSIPIFNGMQARNGLQNARINQQRAELNATNVRNQLRQTIEQAYQNVVAAAKSYQSSKNQAEALRESFKNVEQRKQLNAVTILEYNQTRNDLNRAETDLIRTKYDYIFKLKILDFYQGKTLSF